MKVVKASSHRDHIRHKAIEQETQAERDISAEGYSGPGGLDDTSFDVFSSKLSEKQKSTAQNESESLDLYHMAMALAKEIHDRLSGNEVIKCGPVNLCVEKLVEQLLLNNSHLPVLMSGNAQDYLSSHVVNVSILSIKIGQDIGYDKTGLTELGISAFLHDIGMMKYMKQAMQPGKLSSKEYREIQNHTFMSAGILEEADELPEVAVQVALQHHERIDGSGYPRGLRGESLNIYSRIIHLADTYEALTHSRPHRDRCMPHESVHNILQMKHSYDYKVMKAFINMVGVYPVGSLVRLNTGETCRVAAINQGHPTRPVLHVLLNSDYKKPDEQNIINLLNYPIIHIKECLKQSGD